MHERLIQYYRCPERFVRFAKKGSLSGKPGYFRFGAEATCYGQYCGQPLADSPRGTLRDALSDMEISDGKVVLPFDPSQVADNLRCELYVGDWRTKGALSALIKMYYLIRPALGVGVRRHLQKIHFRGWEREQFPRWPVDCSVDILFEQLLSVCLRLGHADTIPFIWFWPEGLSSCAIMTHDVETKTGRDFCPTLMDINDSYGVKASFQIVPEQRYDVRTGFLSSMRERGFEVVIHDLNHDGHLYKDRAHFLGCATKINAYGEAYGAEGFRAGALYRKQLWFDALEFSYDMSVPNVAHLDPQRGGCCTVMPYFIGDILELPVTTTQDYTLFHILNDYSTELWKRQINLIREKHGLISFIVHPDYILKSRERAVYEGLLDHLARLREEKKVWITTPGEVNRWWRERAEMSLVESEKGWEIEGRGSERARIAYASERNGQFVITLEPADGKGVRCIQRLP